MQFVIQTQVETDYQTVSRLFDDKLLIYLTPPFPPVKILQYGGNQKGAEVRLELDFLLFRQLWVSLITEEYAGADEIFFVDQGTKLPFFLSYWHHKHRLIRQGNETVIADEVTFRTPFFLFDFLFFPVLYLQFLYRKPRYRKFFSLKAT
jgi:ligand-binding SRPBCC domain-containing protein